MSLFSRKMRLIKNAPRKWYVSLLDFALQLGVAVILALMIKASVVEAYMVPTGSMEKTILIDDFLLANKFTYGMKVPIPFTDIRLPALAEPKPGDIVVFKNPLNLKENYVKRCIAVEGQRVKIVNKQVYVDGQLVPLSTTGQFIDSSNVFPYSPQFIDRNGWGPGIRDNMPERVVPKGMLFMMGDNRDNSADSRFWGFLDHRLVLGKAMMIHFSWQPYYSDSDNRMKDANAHFPQPPAISSTKPLSYVENVAFNIVHFPQRIRWDRIGRILR